jgi:2-dehydropantoate 2-reductase
MHVAVIGAGAIGTVLAAAGSDSGHRVTVCTRTPIDSLVLERRGKERILPVNLVNDPSDISACAGPPADVIWVATKAGDTEGTGPWLARLCGPPTVVAAAQNGLDHNDRLRPFVGEATVVPALVYIAAERIRPGRVVHLGGDRIVVPRGNAEAGLGAAVSAGLVVRGSDDMWTATWRKLLGNLIANPITTLTLRRIGVMQDPGIASLARGLLTEAVLVARAEGANLTEVDIEKTLAATAQFGERTGSSMLYDRLAGRPLEHGHLTGEVVRRAQRHGIPVPLNAAVLALLEALDRGRDGMSPLSDR